MPQTVTSTKLGTFKSIVRAAGVSNANGSTSLDVLTVAHNLGACPDIIRSVLRCVHAATSFGSPNLALRSWDASQALFDFPPGPGAGVYRAQFDVICEIAHSLTK